jgi:hypothetical protein
MAKPQTSQPFFPEWVVAQFRYDDSALITYDYVFDQSDPVDKHANLPADFRGQFSQSACKFRSNEFSGWHAAPVKTLQALQLAFFQTGKITEKLFYFQILSLLQTESEPCRVVYIPMIL